MPQFEEVTLEIISNDGQEAIADVSVAGEIVDTCSFEREEESVKAFREAFPVGHRQTGKRLKATECLYQELKTNALLSRMGL